MAGRGDAGIALGLEASAACWIVFRACCDSFGRSQWKNTMNDGAAAAGGGGGGAATAGAPNLYWMLAIRLKLFLRSLPLIVKGNPPAALE